MKHLSPPQAMFIMPHLGGVVELKAFWYNSDGTALLFHPNPVDAADALCVRLDWKNDG